MEENQKNLIHIVLIYFITIFLYFLFQLLCEGKLINIYPKNNFNDEKYIKLWKETTSYQRYTFSDSYYKFIQKLENILNELKQSIKNSNIEMQIEKLINSTYETSDSKYKYTPTIIVKLIPKNKNITNKNKLLIAAHFDGHNLTEGGTAYDDQINIISMIGTIDALINNNYNINTQIDFLFDGLEELGLISVKTFINKYNKSNTQYDYLNLEGMGSYTPYVYILKNNLGSKNIIKSLVKTKGSILLPLNFLYDKNITTSYTDCIVFDEQNWKGGMNVFIGLSSHYHSKYDKIYKDYHLSICGHQLLDFVINYYPFDNKENGNVFSYGISPFSLYVNDTFVYSFVPIFFIIIVLFICLIEGNDKNNYNVLKEIIKGFIGIFFILGFYIFEGYISFKFNPCSFASNQFFVILISFSGLYIFYIIQFIFKVKKWDLIRLLIDAFIMLICITNDLSLPFILNSIFSLLFYLVKNIYLRYIFVIMRSVIMSIFYSILVPLVMQFTTNLKGLFADIFLYVFFFLFTFHCSIFGFAITYNDEDKNIFSDELKKNLKDENKIIDYNIKFSKDKIILKEGNKKLYSIIINSIIIISPILIILIIIFKPYPYNEFYTIRGEFMEIFDENNKEVNLIFYPNKGIDYLKKLTKENKNITYYENYTISFNKNGNAFILNLTNENFPCEINKKNIYFSNKENELYFKFDNINSTCISAIFIIIDCDKCVIEGNGKKYNYERNEKYIMRLRVGKKENEEINTKREIDTIIKVNSTNYKIDIIFNSRIVNENYLNFINSFGESAITAQKSRIINDLLYIYHLNQSINRK